MACYGDASIEDESRWQKDQAFFTDRLVAMERVLRVLVKGLP